MNNSTHIKSLDSIRGLASFTVVNLHCLLVFPVIYEMVMHGNIGDLQSNKPSTIISFLLTYTPIHILWDGGAAVILFFILSGFVLSIPFYKNDKVSYSSFIIKRFCRIYIPYFISLLFALILRYTLKNQAHINELSSNFNSLWRDPITIKTLINHIFMIGGTAGEESHILNGVIWTLVHELRISIILPFLVYIIKKLPFKVGIFFPVLILIFQRELWVFLNPDSLFIQGLIQTIYYSSFFIMGILLCKYKNTLIIFNTKCKTNTKIILLILALMLYNWKWNIGFLLNIKIDFINEWITAIGACMIITLSLEGKIGALFQKKWMVWLGKISYSLYLVHSPILLALLYAFHKSIPYWVILLLIPSVTLIAATIFHKYVEKPSISIGHKLAEYNKRRIIKH